MEEIRTDVLVVGGGLAGTLAALAAREEGADVCIAMKGEAGLTGNSARAGGVFATVLEGFSLPDDSVEIMVGIISAADGSCPTPRWCGWSQPSRARP